MRTNTFLISTWLTSVLLFSNSAFASAGVPGQSSPATDSNSAPKSSTNYKDDRLWWSDPVELKDTSSAEKFSACLPANAVVTGQSSSFESADAGKNSTATQWLSVKLADSQNNAPFPKGVPACSNVGGTPDVYPNRIYYVSAGDAQRAYREGFDFGVLTVPFKWQLTGAKNISGSASLGPYLGYRIPIPGWGDLNPLIFAGASSINTTSTTSTGSSSSQAVAGFSYGVGLMWSIKDSAFSVGAVLGADHVSSDSQYKYNDKPWLSFEVGYSFSQ